VLETEKAVRRVTSPFAFNGNLESAFGQFPQDLGSDADVTGDGKIGAEELLWVLQKISGLR